MTSFDECPPSPDLESAVKNVNNLIAEINKLFPTSIESNFEVEEYEIIVDQGILKLWKKIGERNENIAKLMEEIEKAGWKFVKKGASTLIKDLQEACSKKTKKTIGK